MNELDRFEQLIYAALSNVDESYYSTTYRNVDNFRMAFGIRRGEFVGNDFAKFGERVFCYEFYHQLRLLLDNERNYTPNFLENAKLQGEVDKMRVLDLIERFGLRPLDHEYIPDFLMHTPGNANFHPYVIEVKADNRIQLKSVYHDLQKIDQFITRYNYRRGMFILINSDPEYLAGIINDNIGEFRRLEGYDRIKIVCKRNQSFDHVIVN